VSACPQRHPPSLISSPFRDLGFAPWTTLGTRTHPHVRGSNGRGLALRACPRPRRRQAFALGGWRMKSGDFNALNFLDPIWSSPPKPPVSLTHLVAGKGRMASDRCGGEGRSSGKLCRRGPSGSNLAFLVPVGRGTQIRRDVRVGGTAGGRTTLAVRDQARWPDPPVAGSKARLQQGPASRACG
jgi:hypothetical protein